MITVEIHNAHMIETLLEYLRTGKFQSTFLQPCPLSFVIQILKQLQAPFQLFR